MCVIYAVYKNMPNDAELERGADQNEDGAGVCWLDHSKKTVRWVKGLDSKVDSVKKVIADNKIVPPYAIHFRTASIGGVNTELTHPFPVAKGIPTWEAGNAPLVLMHNGHVADWKQWFFPMAITHKDLMPLPPWSDSRALAYAVYAKGEGVLDFIIGGSRVLILDSTPSEGCSETDPESYMRLYGSWVHDKKGGYYQSIDTATVYRGKARGVSGTCDYGRAMTETSHTTDAGSCSKTNVWTIDELETLANEIKREQESAAIIVGA